MGEKNFKNFGSHLNIYAQSKIFSLIAVVDKSRYKKKVFQKNFSKKILFFKSIDEMLSRVKPDIISISTPAKYNYYMLNKIAKTNCRFVILEKPVASSLKEFLKLEPFFQQKNIVVNYQRNLSYEYENILKNNKFISARLLYNGGLINAASHMIALLLKYFGDIKKIILLDFCSKNIKNKDISFSFVLYFGNNFYCIFEGCDRLNFNAFELEFLSKKGSVFLKSCGNTYFKDKIIKHKNLNSYPIVNISRKSLKNLNVSNKKYIERFVSNSKFMIHEKKINYIISQKTIKIIEDIKKLTN
jgi:predicted dehydrogenase